MSDYYDNLSSLDKHMDQQQIIQRYHYDCFAARFLERSILCVVHAAGIYTANCWFQLTPLFFLWLNHLITTFSRSGVYQGWLRACAFFPLIFQLGHVGFLKTKFPHPQLFGFPHQTISNR